MKKEKTKLLASNNPPSTFILCKLPLRPVFLYYTLLTLGCWLTQKRKGI